MPYKYTNLFGKTYTVNTDKPKSHKPKNYKHWSYYRRLIHVIHTHRNAKNIKWHSLFNIVNNYLNNDLNHGYRVNSWQVNEAVKQMKSYKDLTPNKQRNSPVSIRKIARSFKVSLPTLYRYYHQRYN